MNDPNLLLMISVFCIGILAGMKIHDIIKITNEQLKEKKEKS